MERESATSTDPLNSERDNGLDTEEEFIDGQMPPKSRKVTLIETYADD